MHTDLHDIYVSHVHLIYKSVDFVYIPSVHNTLYQETVMFNSNCLITVSSLILFKFVMFHAVSSHWFFIINITFLCVNYILIVDRK